MRARGTWILVYFLCFSRRGAGGLALSPDVQARDYCAPPLPVLLPGACSWVKVEGGVTLDFCNKPGLERASTRSNLA